MADDNIKTLDARQRALFAKKSLLHAFWQECADHFYVERADFISDRVWGEELAAHLFDSAPLLNRRDLGNAFASMLRPRGQPWFRAGVDDEELMEQPGVARYMDFVTERMRGLMYARHTGFVEATKEGDHDIAAFGNYVITPETWLDPRSGQRRLIYRCWHLRDCAWVENAAGPVDLMFRKDKCSARQFKQKFPDADFGDALKQAIDKTPDQEFEYCHAMLPAEDYDYYNKPKLKAPYASVYWTTGDLRLLREQPSHEFRYVVGRWQRMSRNPYAFSPAAVASLSDGRGIQIMARVMLEAGEKQVDPPMKLTEKAIRGEVNLFAGGKTWVDYEYNEKMGKAIEPILLGGNTPLDVSLLDRFKQQMKDAWYLTKLTLPSQAKTAFETAQLVEEFVRANIPLFEPMESNNAALLDETAALLRRLGAFGTPDMVPPELRDSQIEFKFANPLQDAIERNKVNQATTALGLAAGAAKIDPNAVRGVDWSEVVGDAVRGSGAPADWLRDPDQVAAEIAAEKQQQQVAGNVVGALNTAGQAADVVNRGTEAAARLRDLALQPSVDQQVAYGPT